MSSLLTAVILAAGKGTRMKSAKAKVLHEVFFRPMIHHVLDAVGRTDISRSILIVGHQQEKVIEITKKYPATPVTQKEQLGTGHAVLVSEQECEGASQVLILYGDTPLIQSDRLEAMIAQHMQTNATVTLMTTRLDTPFGYGRIIKDTHGSIQRIVEQKDASPEEQHITEINTGIYMVQKDFLFQALKQVGTDNRQREIYLTDIIALAVGAGLQVQEFFHPKAIDVLGVNSRVELAEAHRELQMRRNHELMVAGNTLLNPENITISPNVTLEGDSVIHAGVHITGNSVIARGCTIAPGAIIHDCRIGRGVTVGAHAVLTNCTIGNGEEIAPLTHK